MIFSLPNSDLPIPITIDRLIRIPIIKLSLSILVELKNLGIHEDPVWRAEKKKGRVVEESDRYLFSWRFSEDKKNMFFSRGLLSRIIGVLKLRGISYEIIDNRNSVALFQVDLKPTVKLLNYQIRAIDELIQTDGAILHSPCGSGKTVIGFGVIAKIKQPTLIIVNTMEIMKQWVDGAKLFLDLRGRKTIGQFGGGKHLIRDITVATHQSLNNLEREDWIKINKKFGCLICDECDISAAPTILATLNNSRAKYRYGVSASIRRKDCREFLVFDSISPRIVKIDEDDLENEGRSVLADVEFVLSNSEMKTPVYKFRGSDGELKEDLDWNEIYNRLAANLPRNELILKKIIETVGMGHKVLVLSVRVEHCKYLFQELKNRGINSALLVGKVNKEFRKEIVKKAIAGKIEVLVATNSLAYRGLDIPILSCLHLTMPTSNPEYIKQGTGRIRRVYEGKLKPLVVDYADTFSPIVFGMAKSRSKIYRALGFRILNPGVV
jgi:superfamily II DNA or RNA helicase